MSDFNSLSWAPVMPSYLGGTFLGFLCTCSKCKRFATIDGKHGIYWKTKATLKQHEKNDEARMASTSTSSASIAHLGSASHLDDAMSSHSSLIPSVTRTHESQAIDDAPRFSTAWSPLNVSVEMPRSPSAEPASPPHPHLPFENSVTEDVLVMDPDQELDAVLDALRALESHQDVSEGRLDLEDEMAEDVGEAARSLNTSKDWSNLSLHERQRRWEEEEPEGEDESGEEEEMPKEPSGSVRVENFGPVLDGPGVRSLDSQPVKYDMTMRLSKAVRNSRSDSAVQSLLVFVLISSLIAGVLRRTADAMLDALPVLILSFVSAIAPSSVPAATELLKSVPNSLVTAKHLLLGKSDIIPYVACVKCFAIHPPLEEHLSPYPRTCGKKIAPKPRACQEALLVEKHGELVRPLRARRVVAMKPIKSWVAEMLMRPGFLGQLKANAAREPSTDGILRDIWDAEELREFRGKDGRLFRHGFTNLVFGFYQDWFNPFGNKISGQHVSSGAIMLFLCNLPPQERYKPENMCLVMVTPHHEPSMNQINYLVELVVECLEEFWFQGVEYSASLESRQPLTFYAAMLLITGDLPGVRKTACFTGSKSKLNACFLDYVTKKDLGSTGPFEFRTDASWREASERYRAEPRVRERKKLATSTGIRYSPFDRLPYLSLPRAMTIDPMHNVLLGIVARHIRTILGSDNTIKGMNKAQRNAIPPPPRQFPPTDEPFFPDPMISPSTINSSSSNMYPFDNDHSSSSSAPHFHNDPPTILDAIENDPSSSNSTSFNKKKAVESLSAKKRPTASRTGGKGPAAAVMRARVVASRRRKSKGKETGKEREASSGAEEMCDRREEGMEGDAGDEEDEEKWDPQLLVLGKLDQAALGRLTTEVEMPSWMGRLCRKPGDKGSGKLTADEWRTNITLIIPVFLAFRWGITAPDTTRTYLHFSSVLFLLSVINICIRRSVDTAYLDTAEELARSYVKSLKDLHLSYVYVPNHHAFLHLPLHIRRFGPVYGWWCFAGERMNGLLTKVNSNNQVGAIEKTTMMTFNTTIQFFTFIQQTTHPLLRRIYTAFATRRLDDRGTTAELVSQLLTSDDAQPAEHLASLLQSPPSGTLDAITHSLVIQKLNSRLPLPRFRLPMSVDRTKINLPNLAAIKSTLFVNGLHLSTRSKHAGNSNVALVGTKEVVSIQQIFVFWGRDENNQPVPEVWLRVQRRTPLPLEFASIWRRWIWSNIVDYLETFEHPSVKDIISPSDVLCHVAIHPSKTLNAIRSPEEPPRTGPDVTVAVILDRT